MHSMNINKDFMEQQEVRKQIPNDHLANERTLLAWVRTGIGIMAFGFVVVKFSLFINQLAAMVGRKDIATAQHGYSGFVGISLVVLGALSLVLSFVKYKQTEAQLLQNRYKTNSTLIFTLILAIFVMSLFLIWYLIQNIRQ